MLAPARPPGVPALAAWDFAEQAWVQEERDAHGERHGLLRVFAEYGAELLVQHYREGRRHGPFERFYPSGKLAQVGRYFDDYLDGLTVSFSEGDESHSIRTCCLPPGTRVLKQEHRRGQLLAEAFFDSSGAQLFDSTPGAEGELREREGDVWLLSFGFWPARERLPILRGEEAVSVAQPLSELRSAIVRAAQRVEACSAVTPDVSALTREALPLRQLSVALEEGETPVLVDEEPRLDGLTPEQLAGRAGVEWTALCWLCWAAGLDTIGLPERIEPRPELRSALVHASARVEALELGLPEASVCFHGLDETSLPASALARLAAHYREIRAVLLFAIDGECVSPWQDDLGRSVGVSP